MFTKRKSLWKKNDKKVQMDKLLIIEDDSSTLARYINVFRNKGYQVRGVSSLEEAYKLFIAKRPDCIVSDLHFPDSNCIEDFYINVIKFQETKKERLCPLVILTASDAKEDVEILAKAGIHAVHLKSDRIDSIAETIKNEIMEYKKWNFRRIN